MTRLALALVVLFLAACAGPAPAGSVPPPSHPPTADDNRQAAEHEARSLLSLVRVPPAARPIGTAPALLAEPMSRPATDSLIDRTSFWRIDLPAGQALRWMEAHPPPGLTRSGSSTEHAPIGAVDGRSYGAEPSDAWQSAQVQIAVAADGASAGIVRADAMVVWLDPRPLRDSAPGTRMWVTAAGGCPADDHGTVGVTNPDQSDLDAAMLPAGAPTAALICDYTGMNGHPEFHLRSRRHLDAAAASRLAGTVAAVPLSHTLGGPTSCPAADGSAAVVVLSYPGRPDVDLQVAESGCRTMGNGHVLTRAVDLTGLGR
jgi:hypothetical protein